MEADPLSVDCPGRPATPLESSPPASLKELTTAAKLARWLLMAPAAPRTKVPALIFELLHDVFTPERVNVPLLGFVRPRLLTRIKLSAPVPALANEMLLVLPVAEPMDPKKTFAADLLIVRTAFVAFMVLMSLGPPVLTAGETRKTAPPLIVMALLIS